ncbi:MAG TPA: ABC transporter substrate-binding protein [Pseudolabrys sp.]|nr:ABC transporter substrate-binding protein [Pseudolabrys sp.]
MKRRAFLSILGSAVALWPLVARAQSERVRRIGILMPFPPTNAEMQVRVRAFREELRKRGWASGVTAQFDERWTGDNMDLIRSAASNLVELNPDAILAVGGRVIPVLMQLTQSIPIVNPGGSDPVGRGYAQSLAHPGGNVTGFSTMEMSIVGKMLQTLKEIAPEVTHASIIYNPENPVGAIFSRSFESAARSLGIEPTIAHIHGVADIEQAVEAVAARPNGGVFIPPDITLSAFIERTVAAIGRHRLPAIYSEREFVTKGGLLYYGTDRIELYRGAASYVDRILRGEKPSDLPYQQPTKYELVINLRAAKALGLTIPPKLLFTADEVIE